MSQYRSRSRLLDQRSRSYYCVKVVRLNTALAVDYLILILNNMKTEYIRRLNTALAVDYLIFLNIAIFENKVCLNTALAVDYLIFVSQVHACIYTRLNTALAVDYLIKFSINRLETTAKSRKSKNLLSATKIALFAKNFANVPLLFVQIRHFLYPSNRYMPEYGFITI